jgi:hypothetical protein
MIRAIFPCKPRFIASPLLPSTCYQVTGNVSGVRTIGIVRHCRDASTNRKVGKRDKHISSTTSASRRPSCAPRQYLKPLPNVRCGLVVALVKRVISKRSGSGYTSGSRLATQGQQRPVRLYADVCPASQCPIRQPPRPIRWGAARGDGLRTVCLHSSVPGFHGERCAGSVSASRIRAKRFSRMNIASKRLPAGVLMPEARQECWQILLQWMWNLRLELGQHLFATPMQTTAFAPVLEAYQVPTLEQMVEASQASTVVYGPAQWARHSFDFRLFKICFYASTR